MTESPVKNNGVPLSHLDIQKRELIILKGITTSRIEQALKANNPYPARVFLKVDNQEQDIPVFFRIKGKPVDRKIFTNNDKYCLDCGAQANYPNRLSHAWWCKYNKEGKQKPEEDNWIKPKIKKGSYLQVEGHFDNPKNGSDRPSFTATSYQLLDPHLQGKFILAQATQKLPHFEQALAQIKQTRELLENHE